MARSVTAGELALLTAAAVQHWVKLEIEDADGVLQDWSSWVEEWTVDEDIDQPIAQATVRFRLDADGSGGPFSLSPLRTDSVLNRDSTDSYAPAIDPGRVLRISTATLAPGSTPAGSDYKNLFEGYVDRLQAPGASLTVTARDLGAVLADAWMVKPWHLVKAGDPAVAIETCLQNIIDQALGAGVVTLYTPVSPSYLVTVFDYNVEPCFTALTRLAQTIGWDVRYRWDSGTASWRLTFYEPPRSKTTPDWTLGPSDYLTIEELAIDRTNVRNHITIRYADAAGTEQSPVGRFDVDSSNKYGFRPLIIQEATGSPIDTLAEATAMADAILADLKDPKADHAVERFLFWPVELHDLIRFEPNGRHYDENQDWAVVGFRHTGAEKSLRTRLTVRGSPCGAYRGWFKRGQYVPGGPAKAQILNASVATSGATGIITAVVNDATALGTNQFEYRVDGGSWVAADVPTDRQLIIDLALSDSATQAVELRCLSTAGLYSEIVPVTLPKHDTGTTGAFLNVSSTPSASTYTISYTWSGDTLELYIDGTSTTVPASPFVVSRPAAGANPKEYYFRVLVGGNIVATDRVQIVPIDGDTFAADVQGSQTGQNDTTVTFVVTAVNPKTGANMSVTVYAEGCSATVGGTPISAGYSVTVTAPVTIVANRPAKGQPPGHMRAVGTVGYAEEWFGTVSEQTADFTPPTFDVTVSPGSTAYTFTYSSSGTVYLRTDGGSFAAAPASPFTVSRNAAGGSDKTIQLYALGTNGVATDPRTFTVPAQAGSSGSTAYAITAPSCSISTSGDTFTYTWSCNPAPPSGGYFSILWQDDDAHVGWGAKVGVTSGSSLTKAGDHGYDLIAGTSYHMQAYIQLNDSGGNLLGTSPTTTTPFNHL